MSEKKEVKKIFTSGKRKTAVARAFTRKGKGIIKVNDKPIEFYPIPLLREKLMDPIRLIGDKASEIDIDVTVRGGGTTGQVDASRTAIAKGIIGYFKDDSIEETFRLFDRTLLVNDIRRKLPKKPMGSGARAKRQKSYR